MFVFVGLRATQALNKSGKTGKTGTSFLRDASHHGVMKDGFRNILLALTSPGNLPVLGGFLSEAFPQPLFFFFFLCIPNFQWSPLVLLGLQNLQFLIPHSHRTSNPIPMQVLQGCIASKIRCTPASVPQSTIYSEKSRETVA